MICWSPGDFNLARFLKALSTLLSVTPQISFGCVCARPRLFSLASFFPQQQLECNAGLGIPIDIWCISLAQCVLPKQSGCQSMVPTFFFGWRFYSTALSNVALGVALGDVRAAWVSVLWIILMTTFAGDGSIRLASQRLLHAVVAWLNTALVVGLIVTGQVPDRGWRFTISSSFHYALLVSRATWWCKSLTTILAICARSSPGAALAIML